MLNSLRSKYSFLKKLFGKEYEFVLKKEKKIINESVAISSDLLDYINSLSIEFIFAEFGENRVNSGGAEFNYINRLDPTLSGIKKFFPNAKITVYTDFEWQNVDYNVINVNSPVIDLNHSRYGYRTADYFKFFGLLNSKADFKCAIDSDMYFVNENVYSLITLTEKFGFCVPYNVRQLLNYDMRISFDTQNINDLSLGNGHSYNQSPMTLWKNDDRGLNFYQNCTSIMKNDPSRASLVMWKAAWKTGVYPYVLPKQFCVCIGDEGCGDEIILHLGHQIIKDYYSL